MERCDFNFFVLVFVLKQRKLFYCDFCLFFWFFFKGKKSKYNNVRFLDLSICVKEIKELLIKFNLKKNKS